ncbi:MAG: NUDIX hydrolase [Chloroflexi bacterium]|nr:NUDIX hydrolase [Chloroflexota bacterium]
MTDDVDVPPLRPPPSTISDPKWLKWAKRLAAVAQNGLAYATNPFDLERYQLVRSIAAEMLAAGWAGDGHLIRGRLEREVGHATPKVDVRGVVFRDGQVLLVKERADGGWTLPGGWADVYDSPSEAVEREIYEESGYRTRARRLLALYDRARHGHPPIPFHAYKAFFLCELVGGAPAASMETDGVGFFPETALPELSVTRVTADQIHRMFAHYYQPDLPTDFD